MGLVLFPERPIWVNAQTVITPSIFLSVEPNPTGVGFPITIVASVQPVLAGDTRIITFTLNVTLPDGTYQVLSPSERSGITNESESFGYQYTPTEKGDFIVTFSVSGASSDNTIYLPSENQTTLTAVQNPYPSMSPSLSPTPSPSSESVFRVIDTVEVGGGPGGVAYDSGKGEIFVVNQYDGTLSVISDSNNTVVATIPVGNSPDGVAYDSGKGEIFVTNRVSNTVSVVSDSSNTVIANVILNPGAQGSVFDPRGIAYDSGKGEIFVADEVGTFSVLSGGLFFIEKGIGMVSVISDSNNTVIATIPVGYSPSAVAYDSGKGEIFVTTEANYPTFTGVSVISDSNNTVVATIPVGNSPDGVAYDSGKGEIFVTNSGDNTTSVISDSNNAVVATLAVGAYPQGIAYDSGKGEIFVANYVSNTVSVISDSNNTVIATVTGVSYPYGVAYDSAKSEMLVTKKYVQYYVMAPPSVSNTVFVISDYPALAAPFVSALPFKIDQGETSNLTSTTVTTGVSPYTYQWFSETPGNLSYTSICGATASSYNFATSTSTATGNWTFILQVTDATGATVNSTATTVTVNIPASNPTALVFSPAAIILIVILIVAVCMITFAYKKFTRTNSDSKQTGKAPNQRIKYFRDKPARGQTDPHSSRYLS
jgi:YVTN family beta-propeller protein